MKQAELIFEAKTPRALSVTDAVRGAARALEARFSDLWIEGEISNFKRHGSGHLYFSLKDAQTQLPCVFFRMEASRLRFAPEDGLKVRCRGRLSIYEQQGKFQFYVVAMEPAGLGAAQLALEQLKQRLAAEGLFDEKRKRLLPRTPRTIGIVTSRTGAAVRDIIRVLHRRSAVRILVSPAVVQGDTAPQSLCAALALLEQARALDLVILGRGGGSAEDLGAFNDERVVRAVAGCRVPIISAVGHEVDVTLCDFAADVRAPTPSAAAELAVPVDSELRAELATLEVRLRRQVMAQLSRCRMALGRSADRLNRRRVVGDRRQALDELGARLRALHPRARLGLQHAALGELAGRARARAALLVERKRRQLEHQMARLDALSPLRVLERGYAIATTAEGRALRDAKEAAPGEAIDVRLSRGGLHCLVRSRFPD